MEKINLNEGDTLYNRFKNSCSSAIYSSKMGPPLNLTLDLFSLLHASDLSTFPLHHNATMTSLLLKQV